MTWRWARLSSLGESSSAAMALAMALGIVDRLMEVGCVLEAKQLEGSAEGSGEEGRLCGCVEARAKAETATKTLNS